MFAIISHGQFAGDAVSIVWMVEDEPGAPRDMREATVWAGACSCEIHRVSFLTSRNRHFYLLLHAPRIVGFV